jgi:dual specificity phosphatase 3
LADFDFVTLRLATGAALQSPNDVDAIAAAGITDVIDCRNDFNDTGLLASHPAIKVLWNGTTDDGKPKPPQWFGKGIAFALEALSQPHRKVYAHCAAGINRGPSMAYAILRAQGLDAACAEKLVRAARPQVGLRYKADADRAIPILGYY